MNKIDVLGLSRVGLNVTRLVASGYIKQGWCIFFERAASMLVLLFHIGTERWAIAASDIKDVLPFVRLQTFAKGVDTAIIGSGLLNYRGEVMPAVDVSAMVAGTKTPQLLSTRIAIVEKKRGC